MCGGVEQIDPDAGGDGRCSRAKNVFCAEFRFYRLVRLKLSPRIRVLVPAVSSYPAERPF